MSIATQITRLNNNIEAMKTTKQQIKDAMNNDFDIIANEQIESYDTLIENGLELYKDCIPSEVTNQATEISVTDAMKYSRNKLELFGNTSQASYTGKNLWGGFEYTRTNNGVDFAHNIDGSITVNGTATSLATSILKATVDTNNWYKKLSPGTYRFSGGESANIKVQIYDDTGTVIAENGSSSSTLITITEETNVYVRATITNGTTVDTTLYVQIEQGSEATDWEPYVGGVPAPNPDYPQDIHVVTGNNTVEINGSNIFDEEIELGTINYSNGNNANSTTIIRSKNYIPISSTFTIITKEAFASAHTLGFRFYDENYNYIGRITNSQFTNYATINIDNSLDTSKTVAYMRFVDTSADGNTTEKFSIRIDEGTAYEPYYHKEYPIDLSSKNIFDKNNANILNALISSDGTLHTSSTEKTLYIKCKPNTTYTISKIKSKRLRADERSTVPTIGSANVNRITNDTGTSMTYTTSENGNYLLIGYYTNTDTPTEQEILDSIQIKEAPIELCKIGDYQDYLYKENGNWYKYNATTKVVLNGTESWNYSNDVHITTKLGDYAISDNIPFSTKYVGIINGASSRLANYQLAFNNATAQNRLYIKDDRYTTSADFKTYLQGNNVPLYYVLREPTSTQITDETLISQLDAIYEHLQLQKGINNITVTPGDLAPYMKLSYKNYESNLTNE